MDGWLLLKSALIGFAVAAPVGPMGLMCMQRTLAQGQLAGLVLGAGVAAADFTYAAIAAFGVTALTSALLAATPWIKLGGSVLLIYLGVRIALGKASGATSGEAGAGHVRAFATAYGLTLTNLPTILFFAGIFASLGSFASATQSLLFSLGVLLGSLAWWLLLTTLVRFGARFIKQPFMLWVNRLSGAALVGFALYALAGLRGAAV